MYVSFCRRAVSLTLFALLLYAGAGSAETKFGFTPFPYDFTEEAQRKTQDLVVKNSTIYALHLDQCVPWYEVLNDLPLPRGWQKEWDNMARDIPSKNHTRYIAVTPTDTDRENLAPACGAGDGETREMPVELRGKRFDDPVVKKAYMEYVRRAVKKFRPDYINIGIEIDGMARSASRWRQYEALFDHVRSRLRTEFPELKVGAEFILQALMKRSISERVKPLVERSDFLCLSFYPYGSSFGEKFGYPPLGAAPAMWRKPLQWVRGYTDKPIAICETGFISKDIDMPTYGLHMQGSEELQRQFTRDIVRTAKEDDYLFVIWFVAIDYDRLYEKLPKNAATEVYRLWQNIGLLDGNLKPKPAWQEWLAFRDPLPPSNSTKLAKTGSVRKVAAIAPKLKPESPKKAIGFNSRNDLFTCGPGSKVSLRPEEGPTAGSAAMRWTLNYEGDWQWCVKEVSVGSFADSRILKLRARSDRDGMIIVSLAEKGGEAFYALVPITTEWDSFSFRLSDLSVDDEKRQDGKLDPARIASVTLADGAANDGETGTRVIWLSDFGFD